MDFGIEDILNATISGVPKETIFWVILEVIESHLRYDYNEDGIK